MGYRFRKKESIAQGIRRMVQEQIDKALDEARQARVLKAKKIHSVRKRVKKIRALLRLVRPAIGTLYAAENKAFQRIGQNLSPFRDADVLIATLQSLPPMPQVRKKLQAQRRTKARQRDAALTKAVKELEAAHGRIVEWKLPKMSDGVVLQGLKRNLKRMHKAFTLAYESGNDEQFHELRKLVKHHGYHSHILTGPWPGHLRSYEHLLERIGEWLGQDHDLSVLTEHLRKKNARTPEVLAAIAAQQNALRERVQASGQLLLAEKPERFVKRMKKYLVAWRQY